MNEARIEEHASRRWALPGDAVAINDAWTYRQQAEHSGGCEGYA
jgi:hypothetical protein